MSDMEPVDDFLKLYSVVRYDNPNGIYKNSDLDWDDLKTDITRREEQLKIRAQMDLANEAHRANNTIDSDNATDEWLDEKYEQLEQQIKTLDGQE